MYAYGNKLAPSTFGLPKYSNSYNGIPAVGHGLGGIPIRTIIKKLSIETKINASDKEANDRFGHSVSISADGNTLAVGAYLENSRGSAYVYRYSDSNWIETKISASDKAFDDWFGVSVSISADGNTLAVGANREDPSGVSDAGSVYVYRYNGSSWIETKINASDRAIDDYFGYSVSISADGNTLAVGAYSKDPSGVSDAGSVYVYRYNGSNWIETKINASDKEANDRFGRSVSISADGNTLAVGANYEDPSGVSNAGSVYVYRYNGSNWIETKINASDRAIDDNFGYSVSISADGNILAVGAFAEDPSGVSDAGSVYVYRYNGSNWIETKINASDKEANDGFGRSVSISADGNTLAVGAQDEDPSGVSGAGSAYVYKYNGSNWIETKINASDKEADDQFGYSVSISADGNTLAVGANYEDPSGLLDAGSVYVYK